MITNCTDKYIDVWAICWAKEVKAIRLKKREMYLAVLIH